MMKFLSGLLAILLTMMTPTFTMSAEPKQVVLVEVKTNQQKAELVENRVTTPIERELIKLDGVQAINSMATHGLSRTEVYFAENATEQDLLLVKQRVLQINFGADDTPSSITFRLAIGQPR